MMNTLPHESDANFYNLVHQLMGQSGGEGHERRHGPRHAFACNQRIAPLRGPGLPEPDDFFNVRCRDLNSGGISFFLPAAPDFQHFVVELGVPPEVVHMEAVVLHCLEVVIWPSGQIEQFGKDLSLESPKATPRGTERMYQIGAQFTRRLSG